MSEINPSSVGFPTLKKAAWSTAFTAASALAFVILVVAMLASPKWLESLQGFKYALALIPALLVAAGIWITRKHNQHMQASLQQAAQRVHSLSNQEFSGSAGNISAQNALDKALNQVEVTMQKNLSDLEQQEVLVKSIDEQSWHKTHLTQMFDATKGLTDFNELCDKIIRKLANQLNAGVAAIFVNQHFFDSEKEHLFKLQASYAYTRRKGLSNEFAVGEGLIGQCALEKQSIVIADLPEDYISIQSGLGTSIPKEVIALPILFSENVIAVVELGLTRAFTQLEMDYLKDVATSLGVAINGVIESSKTEKLSREIGNQLQAINRSNAAIEFDPEGNILTANSIFLQLMGYELDEVVGQHHSIFVDPEYAQSKAYKQLWKDFKKGKFISDVFNRYTKSGKEVWIQGNYNPIMGPDGKVYKVLKIATDITEAILEKRRVDELSREVNNQIQAINRSNAAIEFDMEGNILTANQIFLDLMGYDLDEIQGKHHSIFVPEEHRESDEYKNWWKSFGSGAFAEGVFKRITKDRKEVWIHGNYNPLIGADGKPYKVMKIATDATESKRQQQLIEESNERLKAQEEELRVQNEELREQSEQLQASEEELRVQQKEMEAINTELEEKAQLLEENNKDIKDKNHALNQAREALNLKAKELEASSKYKSEFLANMSHELRTPLNSVLILSKLLQDNKEKNLTEKQIEFANVIQKSGSDLLKLINEVLDLAKVESGKIELELAEHSVKQVVNDLEMSFKAIAMEKEIDFQIQGDEALESHITTDKMRLEQILKNLLSNAFKFTPKGGNITLGLKKVHSGAAFSSERLLKAKEVIEIFVKDSGIGIPEDKLETVFMAFQQADGSTQRKFGGTGLGLSISKELAEILGGELLLESVEGEGATFSLYLPCELEAQKALTVEEATHQIKQNLDKSLPVNGQTTGKKSTAHLKAVIADDRESIGDGKCILVVEDDLKFAKIVLDFAREKGFKGVVVDQGDLAMEYVAAFEPHAIILDMKLPGLDGWSVLSQLKASQYAHIPVHIMSGLDKRKLGLQLGAVDYLVKPIDTQQLAQTFDRIGEEGGQLSKLLIVEDDEGQNLAIRELVGQKNIETSSAFNGKEAMEYLKSNETDLIILDQGLPDSNGIDLMDEIRELHPQVPVILFTGNDLSNEQLSQLRKFKDTSVVLKTETSHERLLEETELFLHHVKKNGSNGNAAPITAQPLMENLNSLKGKKVLMVDDDMRNIYALQTVLETEGIETEVATTGFEAVEAMKNNAGFDAVLMDIMMPEMDGYEATRQIRDLGFKDLPIIALTAKAMKGDREKSLEAGLSDYLSKPVDIDRLLSLLRVWMYK